MENFIFVQWSEKNSFMKKAPSRKSNASSSSSSVIFPFNPFMKEADIV